MSRTIITFPTLKIEKPVPPAHLLEIVCNPDGSITAHMDSYTAARLGGRDQFGSVVRQKLEWQDALRDAWYAADCPRV